MNIRTFARNGLTALFLAASFPATGAFAQTSGFGHHIDYRESSHSSYRDDYRDDYRQTARTNSAFRSNRGANGARRTRTSRTVDVEVVRESRHGASRQSRREDYRESTRYEEDDFFSGDTRYRDSRSYRRATGRNGRR